MAELFTNLAETTTTVALNNVTDPVTFTVSDATNLPNAVTGSVDYFHAEVDSGTSIEILRCQRSGNSITADRAQEGTAKIPHAAGVRFAHGLTAASIQQIPAYVQASTLTTKGDSFVRTATGITRNPVGANGTVEIADSTQATGKRWGSVGGGGGGTGVNWQEPDYTIYFDGTNYFARNEKTQTVDYTSPTSVHAVINSAATALGTGTTFAGTGGLIALSTPTNKVMTTQQSIAMQNQVTLRGTGRGCIIKVGGAAGNWTGATYQNPKAVIDAAGANGVSRIKIEGVAIDCSNYSGTTGILYEKGGGSTGGNDGHSYFLFNEVRNFDQIGMQLGRLNSTGGTSTAWLLGNQVVDNSGNNAIGVAFFVADAHYGWGNNIKLGGTNSICMVIQANSVHVLNGGHMVNNGSSSHPLISIHGANPCRIEGVYLDNLSHGPAIGINLSDGSAFPYNMGGQSTRIVISNNWCHVSGNAANGLSPFQLNTVNGECHGITIANNIMEGDVNPMLSMVDITNGAAHDIQESLVMVGNQAMNCTNFITKDNGLGTPAVGTGMNIIEDSGGNGATIRVGP